MPTSPFKTIYTLHPEMPVLGETLPGHSSWYVFRIQRVMEAEPDLGAVIGWYRMWGRERRVR